MRRDPYVPEVTRREMVARLSSAAVAAATLGGAAFLLHDRRKVEPAAPSIPDWRIPGSGEGARAVAARGKDPGANVRRAVAALGGMERFVKRGETVLIKPNAGWDRLPEQAANTDPGVVGALVRLCFAAGAAHVVVADLSVNDPARSFARSGIEAAAVKAGADVLDARRAAFVPAVLGGSAAGLGVLETLLRADRVINVPVAKHHSLSRVTLGMKNWFGVLGRGRNRLHQGIHRSVAELGATFRPTLTVVDASRVLLSNGPQGGSLSDVKAVNAVAAGVDPVLCDVWGAAQLGVDPRSLDYLAEAERRGLGKSDLSLVYELGTA